MSDRPTHPYSRTHSVNQLQHYMQISLTLSFSSYRVHVWSRRIVQAQELEDAGEYMQAMKLWRAAYKICPQLEEPTWNSNGAHFLRQQGRDSRRNTNSAGSPDTLTSVVGACRWWQVLVADVNSARASPARTRIHVHAGYWVELYSI